MHANGDELRTPAELVELAAGGEIVLFYVGLQLCWADR